jgi:endonuclease YncB( thermonuclease family)
VDVVIESLDDKNLYGTVLYNQKNIAVELLRQGLAYFIDWTAKATSQYQELKKAEEYE